MLKENLLLTCSGGETSMFMVVWCIKHLSDDYNILVVFANTGQEDDETLEFLHNCELHFKIPIIWIEAKVFHGQRKSSGFTVVDYMSAVRRDDWAALETTPFEEVIKKYGIPNHSRLHCTRELKMNPLKNYAKHVWGIKAKWYTAIGLREDEMDRVNSKHKELRLMYPLVQKKYIPMTKKKINFWWSQQPFRLKLKGYQGNCVACYKKSRNKLLVLAQEDSERFEFFEYAEKVYGNVNGLVPKKIFRLDEHGEPTKKWDLEVIPVDEYKNVIYRDFTSTEDILELSKAFTGSVEDDHIETESCEVFSSCGDDN